MNKTAHQIADAVLCKLAQKPKSPPGVGIPESEMNKGPLTPTETQDLMKRLTFPKIEPERTRLPDKVTE